MATLPTTPRIILLTATLLVGFSLPGRAQYSQLYSNNFDSYTAGSYPYPANPLPGWNYMPSANGLVPSITNAVNASGQALNMNGYGGGASAWMSVNNALLAGVTDWTLSGDSRYLASNHTPWYGVGGLLLSSTGDLSGDYIWLAIQSGWGEVDATTTWARPTLNWSLAGTNGGGVLFPWAPPAGVTDVVGNAMRMSTDTWGPATMGLSRTNGSSSLAYNISSPVDGPFSGFLSFSGAQAAALDNLKYVGFANYLSVWQYDSLSASVRAYGWTGGPGDWSATNNWTGGLAASNGTVVNFSGAGGASTNDSLGSVTGITFSNGAGSYTVSGNAVTLGAAGIANNSGNLQTVSNDLTLGASSAVSSASGAVVVAGNTALSNNTLTLAATADMTNSGVISGSGAVVKTGAGTATLSGNNTYSGATTIAGGTLRISGNNRLGNTNTTLTISNAGVLEVTAAGTLTNAITIGAGNGVLSNSSAGALVIAGAVSKNGTVLTSRSGSGTNVFTGVISGASANSDFIVDGGTTVFSNTNTYNGPTIITNGGTLVLAVDDAMPAGSNLILGGGTFRVGVENYNADSQLSMGTLTLTANSTIDLGNFGTSGDRNLVFGDSTSVTWTTNAVLTITNWQGVAQTQSDVTKLLFGVGGLTSTQLGQIYFAGQNINGGQLLGSGELVPIPEARIVWAALALALFILWRERRRWRSFPARLRREPGCPSRRSSIVSSRGAPTWPFTKT